MSNRPKWENYFLNIAEVVSSRATCKRRKVGVVIVDKENHIVSSGYNGSPTNQPHCDEIGCLMVDGKCRRTIHGDINAIIHCRDRDALIGSTMYIHNGTPCTPCAQAIISAGIKRVVCDSTYPDEVAKDLLKAARVELIIK